MVPVNRVHYSYDRLILLVICNNVWSNPFGAFSAGDVNHWYEVNVGSCQVSIIAHAPQGHVKIGI